MLASEAGYTVYALGSTTGELEKLAAECAAAGKGKIIPCGFDLKDDVAVQAFVWLAQPQLESSLAAAERLVSKPEPLRCLWLRHLL